MIGVARIMGLLYIAFGLLGLVAVLFVVNNGGAGRDTELGWYLAFASIGTIAAGALIGAVGEIGLVAHRILAASQGPATAVRTVATPPQWDVTGKDRNGRANSARVIGATREDAFLAATMNGIVTVETMERA